MRNTSKVTTYIPDATLTPAPVRTTTDLQSGDRINRARPTKSVIAFMFGGSDRSERDCSLEEFFIGKGTELLIIFVSLAWGGGVR